MSVQVYVPTDARDQMLAALAIEDDGTRESISAFVRRAILRELAHRKAVV